VRDNRDLHALVSTTVSEILVSRRLLSFVNFAGVLPAEDRSGEERGMMIRCSLLLARKSASRAESGGGGTLPWRDTISSARLKETHFEPAAPG
jgi:hypothetical protein